MKNNFDNFIRDSLESLKSLESFEKSSKPNKEQKEIILNKVLLTKNNSISPRFKTLVYVYPWRFAFGASTLQAVVLTIVFGSKYTNLLFEFLGR